MRRPAPTHPWCVRVLDSAGDAVDKILIYFRNNKVDNLTFDVELLNGDLEVADKLVEVQKEVWGNQAAERRRVGALKTRVTRWQMLRVVVRRRRIRAR